MYGNSSCFIFLSTVISHFYFLILVVIFNCDFNFHFLVERLLNIILYAHWPFIDLLT